MTITTRSGKISDTIEEIGKPAISHPHHGYPASAFRHLIRDDKGDPEQLPTVENNQAEKRRGMDDSTYLGRNSQRLYKQDNMVAWKKRSDFVHHLIRGQEQKRKCKHNNVAS
jgi:hypothetical protein